MKKEYRYFYSLVTGVVERIMVNELDLLDVWQIPLKKRPRNSCNMCYGRFYVTHDKYNKAYIPCKCVKNVIDKENYKTAEISFYIPK